MAGSSCDIRHLYICNNYSFCTRSRMPPQSSQFSHWPPQSFPLPSGLVIISSVTLYVSPQYAPADHSFTVDLVDWVLSGFTFLGNSPNHGSLIGSVRTARYRAYNATGDMSLDYNTVVSHLKVCVCFVCFMLERTVAETSQNW